MADRVLPDSPYWTPPEDVVTLSLSGWRTPPTPGKCYVWRCLTCEPHPEIPTTETIYRARFELVEVDL